MDSALSNDYPLDLLAACTVSRVAANDADDLAEQIRGWDVELTQLHPGPFSGEAVMVYLGPVLICRGMYSRPVLQNLSAPPGCITVTRIAAGSDPLVVRGREFEPGECAVLGPGTEVEAVNRGVQRPTTVSIPLDIWQSESYWLQARDLPYTRGLHLREPGESWIAGFLRRVEWILDALEQAPDAMQRRDVAGSLSDSLLAYVSTLGDAGAGIRTDREARAQRRLAVARARTYIAENLTEPISLAELCRHARAQARSLEYGFQEMLGMSPIGYVRTMRLHRARRLLRSAAVHTRSISEIALDCGFWHLSQFAVDYKLLFGERPSITLRRTEAQLPRSARRRQVMQSPVPKRPIIASLS